MPKPLRRRIDPDDAPELTDEMLDRAEICVGGRIVQRGRPPLGAQPKRAVTLRLDADVLDSYRATGAGWQTRLNADLSKVQTQAQPQARAQDWIRTKRMAGVLLGKTSPNSL